VRKYLKGRDVFNTTAGSEELIDPTVEKFHVFQGYIASTISDQNFTPRIHLPPIY
jgi:hypothetical protein